MPWLAEPTLVEVELENPVIGEAWLLDPAGYPVERISMVSRNGRLRLQLPPEALYVVLKSN